MLRPSRRGFTLIELLAVLAVLGILMSLLLPAVQQVREAARRTECQSRLHQMVVALHDYESSHQVLPPGSLVMGSAMPLQTGWGWGAMVLPFVEQRPLYDRLDFNVGTGQGNNALLLSTPLAVWQCPSDPGPETIVPELDPSLRIAHGNFCGVEGVLYGMSHTRFADIPDGLSSTLFVGERQFLQAEADGITYTSGWCGRVVTFDYLPNNVPHLPVHPNVSINEENGFSSQHPGGAHFALGDSRIRFISENVDGDTLFGLMTRDGGEVTNF